MSRQAFARVKFNFRKALKNKEIRSNGLWLEYRYMNVLQHTRNELNLCLKQNRPDRSYRDTLVSFVILCWVCVYVLSLPATVVLRCKAVSQHQPPLVKLYDNMYTSMGLQNPMFRTPVHCFFPPTF